MVLCPELVPFVDYRFDLSVGSQMLFLCSSIPTTVPLIPGQSPNAFMEYRL
jgi:hypothetical protein